MMPGRGRATWLFIAAFPFRGGLMPGAAPADVPQRFTAILAAASNCNATINATTTPIARSTANVSVNVRVPLNDNAWGTSDFLRDTLLQASRTAVQDRLWDTICPWGLQAASGSLE